ncbi:MAG: AMP-binding protein, partial [Gammaproteobacteria bacterium]|nr:AMP-binding protein [Gammaproteobacteria bacterium]
MQPLWLKHYPQGVPAEIDIRRFASLNDLFEQRCARYGARPAFTNLGVSLGYDDIDRLSRAFAAYLQQELGLVKGERVAFMLPNLLQYPVALFGALCAGLTVVNVNPLHTARELRHQLADSGAVAIMVLENFARTLQEVIADTAVRHVVTTQVGDLFPPFKRGLVNFVVKHVKRMVPRWNLPGAVAFNAALQTGGREAASGQPGELCVGGPQVMRGYWNLPEETTGVLDAEGWLATGDVVSMDERGYLYFVDRKKDVIVVFGFKVWPAEVEDVLLHLPG